MKAFFKTNLENIVALIGSFVLSILFMFKSPLHPWIGGLSDIDSSVFKTVAFMMERGYMPYLDTFDHKGPLLYVLNYMGNQISYYRGIWIIEVIAICICFFMIYKIARLLCKKIPSIIVLLVSTTLLFGYFEAGNFCEEYAMPFIAIATYIFLDYLLNNKVNNLRIIISGFCFGSILMLRPNMIALWIVYCLYIFISLIVTKEYKTLISFIINFLLGAIIIILPLIVWLAMNRAFEAFWECYITFNFAYSSADGGRALLSAKIDSFMYFFNTLISIVSTLSLLLNSRKETFVLNISYLAYYILTLVLTVMSGMAYGHYGMVLIPVFAYPLALIFKRVESIEEIRVQNVVEWLVILYAIVFIVYPSWSPLLKTIPETYKNRGEANYVTREPFNTIIWYVLDNTTEDEKISVYGSWDIAYVISKREHATRYSYQYPIGEVNPDILDDYFTQLEEEQPKIIIIQKYHYDQRMQEFLKENNYEMLWNEEPDFNEGMAVFGKDIS